MEDIEDLNYFLGFELQCSASSLVLTQKKYTYDLLNRTTGMLGSKPYSTPVAHFKNFNLKGFFIV